MPSIKKVVTSALFVTGATALSTLPAGTAEAAMDGWLQEDIDMLEMEMIENALRNYTNPLHRIHSTIDQVTVEDTITYEVQLGDTLSDIAYKFGIPQKEIEQVNHIHNKHKLSIGQKLHIRLKEKEYVVKHGESVDEIVNQLGVSKEELITYNQIVKTMNYTVYPGQTLRIPTAPPEPIHQPIMTVSQQEKREVKIASRSKTDQAGAFQWPLSGIVTSNFGTRWGRMHNGIDISNSDRSNAEIKAAKSGVVTDAYFHRGGYGNLVIIDHGEGVETYYAHLSKISVSEGDKVNSGDLIGYMGRTGKTTGYHLHFEIRRDNNPVNPLKHLP